MDYEIEEAIRIIGEQAYEVAQLRRGLRDRDEEIRELTELVERLREAQAVDGAER